MKIETWQDSSGYWFCRIVDNEYGKTVGKYEFRWWLRRAAKRRYRQYRRDVRWCEQQVKKASGE